MKKFILVFFLCISTLSSFAGWSPVGFAIREERDNNHSNHSTTNATSFTQFPHREDSVYGIRLALSSASNYRMYGGALSFYSNGGGERDGDGDVAGLQIATAFNFTQSAKAGVVQIALFHNQIKLRKKSQPYKSHLNKVIQIGVDNESENTLGIQAGLHNKAENTFGIQAGLYNDAKDLYGIQVGLLNIADDVVGIQTGFINVGVFVRGFQLGIFNIVDEIDGVQAGLFNISSSSNGGIFSIYPLIHISF